MAAFFVAQAIAATPAVRPAVHGDQCSQRFIVSTYRTTASRIYHQHHRILPHQQYRLLHMRQCAVSPAAVHAMQAITLRQRHARNHRRVLARAVARRSCASPVCNRRLAQWMTRRNPGEFACLDGFIRHESGWSQDIQYGGAHTTTPGRLAWGIPQALPPSKMVSAGADWKTSARTQIRWLRTYVRARYGGACQALAFWRANKHY